jgi:hypothetical protein
VSRWSQFKRAAPERRTFQGVVYASIAEMRCAAWLETMARAGAILEWHRGTRLNLEVNNAAGWGRPVGGFIYTPDFVVYARGFAPNVTVLLLEVKGTASRDAFLRIRLAASCQPLPLYVIPSTAYEGSRRPPWPLPQEWGAIAATERGGWKRALARVKGELPAVVRRTRTAPGGKAARGSPAAS